MTCRACVQLPLYIYGIDDIIDTKIIKTPHDILVRLMALDYGRNPDIGTLKKERGGIFSECCNKRFRAKFILYVNEVLFEMVKTDLKDLYIGRKTPTVLKNDISTFRQI